MRHIVIAFTLFVSLLVESAVDSTNDLAQAGADSQGFTKSSATDMGKKPSTGDAGRGEELYKASCVVCHGSQATGGVGPRLAGNPVLSNDQAFWKVVYEGRHMMPSLKGAVTEQQMADIRAWLKTLR
ncbi:MAG TPA: cytochrome c [Nitrospira sp.]|nr:cytochrome c [Nitrospira sp.]